jgi:hypothetical protein
MARFESKGTWFERPSEFDLFARFGLTKTQCPLCGKTDGWRLLSYSHTTSKLRPERESWLAITCLCRAGGFVSMTINGVTRL